MLTTGLRYLWIGLSIVLLLHANSPLPLFAQQETIRGTIAGKIYEKTSRTALSDVRVHAKLITTGQEFHSGKTDGRGSYMISDVPSGIYAFTFEYDGKEYTIEEKFDSRIAMSFLLESCFILDTAEQSAALLAECSSELYAEDQVVSIGPHNFLRASASEPQEDVGYAQTSITVEHSALDCLANDQYAQLTAMIQPGEIVQSSRVYFRAAQHPDFYYVEMAGEGDIFSAVLPIPSPDTEQVVYYIEAVDMDFNNAQTPEADPEVSDSETCEKRNPEAAYFQGDNPDIVVGAVTAGASSIPLGFQATGITGFISASGVVTSVGAAAAGAGSAGAAGAAAAAAGAAGGLGAAGTVIVVTGAAVAGGGIINEVVKEEEASGVKNQ
jgi:hypothetical protein